MTDTATPLTIRRLTRGAALSLAVSSLQVASASIPAQAQSAVKQVSAPDPEVIKQRTQELEAAREQQKKAAELEQKLKADAAAIGQDRTKLNQQLIGIAGQVRDVEGKMADTEGRLRPLDARELQIRASLESRRDEISEVLAALQRAGRRAPPALFVRPEDALQSLRTAMLLGAVVPEMRARATKLASDLGELVALRKNIAEERDRLAADRDNLNDNSARLAALVQERQKQQSDTERDMDAERQRAIALSKQTETLQDLIAKMEQDVKAAARAAAAAELKGTPASLDGKPNLGALKDFRAVEPRDRFCVRQRIIADPG